MKKINLLLGMYEHLIKEKFHIEIAPYTDSELRELIEEYLEEKVDDDDFTRPEMVKFICDEIDLYLP